MIITYFPIIKIIEPEGGEQKYNVHSHIIFLGTYTNIKDISKKWHEITGSQIVNIKAVKNDHNKHLRIKDISVKGTNTILNYVTKYLTKYDIKNIDKYYKSLMINLQLKYKKLLTYYNIKFRYIAEYILNNYINYLHENDREKEAIYKILKINIYKYVEILENY